MEWEFIDCALNGYFAACRDHGFAIPTLEQLERVALASCGRDTIEELDMAALGSTREVIEEKLQEYIDSIENRQK